MYVEGSPLDSVYWKFYVRIFPNTAVLIKRELKNCKSFLDLGCGKNSDVRYFSKEFNSAGVDICKSDLEESRKKGIHNKYFVMDVRNLRFKPRSFDAVLAIDLIEHLSKGEGEKLLRDMERIAKKKVIILTPNGFLEQKVFDDNKHQMHKSGWTASEMRGRGYRVAGFNGVKFLKGERGGVKFRPRHFWRLVSDVSQLVTYHFPEHAFQLFCVKDIE